MHKMPFRDEKPGDTPRVGIFFVVGSKLWMESTPLTQAESYGDFKIHEHGHHEYWEELIKARVVPEDSEYEEYPRGRVAYDTRKGCFSLLADRCILRDNERVAEIAKKLHLQVESTKTDTDSHYRCARCLRQGTNK
jgi:hypothetical protein